MSQAQDRLKAFLEESWGSTLKAWINAFDVDNVQRIYKLEFIEVLRKSGYSGNIQQLWNELDDGNGELSMYKIDPAQAELWTRFREWCKSTFRSVDDLLTRFGNSNEERLRQRQTIKARLAALTETQCRNRMRDLGWQHGQEDLLFAALDSGEGVLKREHFRWLEAEYRRIQRKMDAKSQAIQSLRKQQAHDAQQVTLQSFKKALSKKHGNLVRAWRESFSDHLTMPKTQFLKACATMGFAPESRDLYRMLDKDQSGFASLEELDPATAENLAKFKKFLEAKFGNALNAFEAMDGRKITQEQFCEFLRELGWGAQGAEQAEQGAAEPDAKHGAAERERAAERAEPKKIFQWLDRGRKFLEEADLRLLDKWNPSPFFMAEANTNAKDEVKDLLCQKFNGHFMKAWRHLLDKDGSNRVNWSEFQQACQRLRYEGDIPGAWRAFDTDLSGYLTLNEIDTEASDTLCDFKDWAWDEFGTVRAAFGVFDHDGSNNLSFDEFRSNCRIYGYNGNARKLFDALDINGENALSMSEIAFLDDWDMGLGDGQKSKTDKRQSRIRLMNESVKRHEIKKLEPRRLTELPGRFIDTITEGSRSDVEREESGRSQKVVQVKQALQLRADLPLIPFYRWPIRRAGEDEDPHLPCHYEKRKDRERKHWVRELAEDLLPQTVPPKDLKERHRAPKLPPAVAPPKPTLDELLERSASKGKRLLGLVPRLPSMTKLISEAPHTVR